MNSQFVDKLCDQSDHLSRSAEPVVTQILARSAEPVVTHKHHKNVRFEINDNSNSRFNNNSNNDDCGGNSGVGIGTCCTGFECSRVEVLTSSANTTSTQLRATTIDNDDDNDDDNETARRATPSIIYPQTLTRREKPLLAGMSTEVPKPKSDLVEHSSVRARVGGCVYLHPPVPGIAQLITTSPSARNILGPQPECSSRIIKAQVPAALPTYPTQCLL